MGRGRLAATLAAAGAAALCSAPAATADPFDLGGWSDQFVQLSGETYADLPPALPKGESAGAAVAGGCDVDGDGRDDAIVGAPTADVGGAERVGRVHVVFGSATRAAGDYALGTGGSAGALTIEGDLPAGSGVGTAVACAGDVDGDGYDDLAIGAPATESGGAGSAYVVFGGEELATLGSVDLAALGGRGFAIGGGDSTSNLGVSVAGVGDLDGDGNDEVAVGSSYHFDPADYDPWWNGSVHVVAGKDDSDPVDVSAGGVAMRVLGTPGFTANDEASRVAGIGDIDGDGVPDLVVGAPRFSGANGAGTGAAFAISGAATGDVELAEWDEAGSGVLFPIWGAAPADLANAATSRAGQVVAPAGDVDGDDVPDIAVATHAAGAAVDPGSPRRAFVSVVFGKGGGDPVDLGDLGTDGYTVVGNAFADGNVSDGFGDSLAGLGDVDGDGRGDLAVGAPRVSAGAGMDHLGAVYVLSGAAAAETIDVAALDCEQGARLLGPERQVDLGTGVSLAGGIGAGSGPELLAGAGGDRDSNGNFALAIPLAGLPTACGGGEEVQLEIDWGFRENFRRYVYNGFSPAKPAVPISASAGAFCFANPDAARGGCDPRLRAVSSDPPPPRALRWTAVGAGATDGSDTTVAAQGRVTFRFPAHFFTLRLEDPWFEVADGAIEVRARVDIDVDPSFQGAKSADVRVVLGSFPLAGPAEVTAEHVVWRTGPGVLGASAASALGGFLAAGAELDPVTIAIPRSLGELPEEPTVPKVAEPEPKPPATPPTEKPAAPAKPRVRPLAGPRRIDARGVARLAALRCAKGSPCRVSAPRWTRVRIGGKVRRVRVLAPRRIGAGRSAWLRVKVSPAVARQLAGRRTRARLRIVVRAGDVRTVRTLRVTIAGRRR